MIRDSYRGPDPVRASVKPETPEHAPAQNMLSAHEDSNIEVMSLPVYTCGQVDFLH